MKDEPSDGLYGALPTVVAENRKNDRTIACRGAPRFLARLGAVDGGALDKPPLQSVDELSRRGMGGGASYARRRLAPTTMSHLCPRLPPPAQRRGLPHWGKVVWPGATRCPRGRYLARRSDNRSSARPCTRRYALEPTNPKVEPVTRAMVALARRRSIGSPTSCFEVLPSDRLSCRPLCVRQR